MNYTYGYLRDMSNGPKIFFISPTFLNARGGIEEHINFLIKKNLYVDGLVYRGLRFYDPKTHRRQSIFKVLRRVRGAEVIWSHCPRILLLSKILFPNKKIVNSSHGFIFHNSMSFSRVAYIYAKLLLAKLFCIKVVAVSHSDYGFSPKLISETVENPCKYEPCYDTSNKRNYDFIYVGRITSHKRFDKVLSLVKSFENTKILIITNDDTSSLSLPVNASVKYNVTDEELKHFYGDSKFFISLSEFEGFGLSSIEAISQGCIPILSDNAAYSYFKSQGMLSFGADNHNEIGQIVNGQADCSTMQVQNYKFSERYSFENYKLKVYQIIS